MSRSPRRNCGGEFVFFGAVLGMLTVSKIGRYTMNETTFYICPMCGNIAVKLEDAGIPLLCCGQAMDEMPMNPQDVSVEKHKPVLERLGDVLTVKLGEQEHPMTHEHAIRWVWLDSGGDAQFKRLSPDSPRELKFYLDNDAPVTVYAYCNLHGLWKSEL